MSHLSGVSAHGLLREGLKVRSNVKSWSLVAGALVILAACVLAYILTKPAEADVSMNLNLHSIVRLA